MFSTREIIKEAESLPVEERAIIIDSLLRSLGASTPGIDKIWIDTARRRLSELRSGEVDAIPGEEVFARVKKHFGV